MLRIIRKIFSPERLVGIGLLSAFLALYVADPFVVQSLRDKTFDVYQRIKPREVPPPQGKPVTIIDLDERSLSEIGQWPWSRAVVAQLVEGLYRAGVAEVAFDIVFPEPDRMNPAGMADNLAGLDDATRERLRSLPSNDEILGEVLAKGNAVLGQAGYWGERPDDGTPPVSKSVAWRGMVKGAPKPHAFIPVYTTLVRNLSVLEKGARGHGIFSLVPESDGIVRRVATMFQYKGEIYPALSVEMMRTVFNRRTILAEVGLDGIQQVKIAPRSVFPPHGLSLPTDKIGRVWPYFSKSDKAKYVSAVDVINGTADPALLRGKLTIIGTSAVGMLDVRATPVDSVIPGVEVHAQVVESAFHNAFLSRPAFMQGAELLMIALGGLFMIWLVPVAGAKWTLMLFGVMGGGAGAGSWYLFSEKLILLDATFAMGSTFLLYSTLTYMNFSREEAQKKQTRDAFSKYLSPDMVKSVAENPDKLKLGGDKRDMTLLFCDVRGFTTISEQFDAEGLTKLINKLLTPLTNVILERKGTVDKYMGDCIMAFWNAPLDDAQHAKHGCLSALKMLEEMGPLNDRLEAEAKEEGRKHIPLKVGVGLNSGECVVGNMGSDQRFDYSVLGDTVNLASRLEGQSKAYGVRIVIGDSTNAQVPDLATIELDLIKVKGKTEAVRIFSLLGDETMAADPTFQAFKAKVDEMLAKYRSQDWQGARAANADARTLGAIYQIDGLFDLYDERINVFEQDPPAADWDGVFVATSK